MNMTARKGTIGVLLEVFKDPLVRAKLFELIMPYKIEYGITNHGVVTIWGYSEEFKELQEGEEIPTYAISIDKDNKTVVEHWEPK